MNMITQKEFQLRARTRGCHLVTDEVVRGLGALPEVGVLHLLLKHTSAGLCLNENWDADVRHDMNVIFNHLVPENQPYFKHTLEGCDDMPAHAKSALVGATLTIPITGADSTSALGKAFTCVSFAITAARAPSLPLSFRK